MTPEIKFFEVRDNCTHIPVMCVCITAYADNPQLMRAGFLKQHTYYFLTVLSTMQCNWDYHNWEGGRTMNFVHKFIYKHWDNLVNKQVIDVEFLLGETHECKSSECVSLPVDSDSLLDLERE